MLCLPFLWRTPPADGLGRRIYIISPFERRGTGHGVKKTPFFSENENHQDRPRGLEPHDIFHLHDHQHLSLCINTFPRKNRRTTTTFVTFLVFLACFGGKHGIQGGPTADPAMAGYCFINFRTSQARRSGIGKSRPRKLRLRQQRWDHWHRQPTK